MLSRILFVTSWPRFRNRCLCGRNNGTGLGRRFEWTSVVLPEYIKRLLQHQCNDRHHHNSPDVDVRDDVTVQPDCYSCWHGTNAFTWTSVYRVFETVQSSDLVGMRNLCISLKLFVNLLAYEWTCLLSYTNNRTGSTVWPVLLSTVCSQHPVPSHPSPRRSKLLWWGLVGRRMSGDGVLIYAPHTVFPSRCSCSTHHSSLKQLMTPYQLLQQQAGRRDQCVLACCY